jgi:hypothetical protein
MEIIVGNISQYGKRNAQAQQQQAKSNQTLS